MVIKVKKKKEHNSKTENKDNNYSVYHMSTKETLISSILGASGGAAASYIFFSSGPVCIFTGAVCAATGIRVGKKYFKKKRNKLLLDQFRDFLEALSSSLSAGQNISEAIKAAGCDMTGQYGQDSIIAREVSLIVNGMINGKNAEEMISDFAKRSDQNDIRCFADTFEICNRTGGNMKKIISSSHRVLSEKMQIQNEIETMAAKGKNDLKIMTCLPLVIVPMLKVLGSGGISGNSAMNVVVRMAAVLIIIVAYIIGNFITDIKI